MFLKDYLPNNLLKNAVHLSSIGLNKVAWDRNAAMSVIENLQLVKVGILGGDVYKVDSGKIISLYENWYCEKNSEEDEEHYYSRSKREALAYIDDYPIKKDENIIFRLVFTEPLDLQEGV